jgi:hypothetical protein
LGSEESIKTITTKNWQVTLLPFMTRTIVILAAFFFVASLAQLIYLHNIIQTTPRLNLGETLAGLRINENATTGEMLEVARLKALIALEANSIHNQYHQANVLLMARLWTSYIGFVTGMILATVGAAFILGKLREPVTELTAKLADNNFSLKSASPGLILAVLGTCLMITTLIAHHNIDTRQNAIYIHDSDKASEKNTNNPPPLRSPYLPDTSALSPK